MNALKSYKTIKEIQIVPDEHGLPETVYIRLFGFSKAITAKCLELRTDKKDNINYLLLDRLIHSCSDVGFELIKPNHERVLYSVSGCYISELSKTDYIDIVNH
ncbi:hypothetical protein ACQE3D_25360 (plasmid) [Methylomonas sp. MS20]|uniref:hypothetical protein n=1 Tax=Methylomonas sp. MS20 TaxID=3418769 RepID=UPI003D087326